MKHTGGLRRRMAWGAAAAIAGTAVAVAVALPMNAAGDDDPSRGTGSPGSQSAGAEAPGTVARQLPERERGTGHDPLTTAEEQQAVRIALAGDRPLRMDSENAAGKEGGPQLIEVELGDTAPAGRRADVLFYDYRDDTVVSKTVDLATGRVASSDTAHGVQPAPTLREAAEAAKLMLASPLADGVRQDYAAATGHPLTSADQLTVTAMTYHARPADTGGLARCGEHRCVTLFPQVKNGPRILVRHLVIDLSAREVLHA